MAAFDDLLTWLAGRGLEIVLIILGSVLLARFVAWVGRRITDRIDAASTGGDALVRSEAAKHRHSLTQVLTWAAIVLIYSIAVFFVLDRLGVPVTGLVAPATVLGVGLGFGAQRIVGDVLAGFFIITERQYGFGDVVAITVTGARRAGQRHRRGRHAAGHPGALVQRRGRHRAERADRQGGQPVPRLGAGRRRRPRADRRRRQPGQRDPPRGRPGGLPRSGAAAAAARPADRHGRREPRPRRGQRAHGRPHPARQAVRGGPRPARPRRLGVRPAGHGRAAARRRRHRRSRLGAVRGARRRQPGGGR